MVAGSGARLFGSYPSSPKPPVSPTSPPTPGAEHVFGVNGDEQMYCVMPAGNLVHCSASYGTYV